MKLSDLTGSQRTELKQLIVEVRNKRRGEGTSFSELANADGLVSDEDLEAWRKDTEFSLDDFLCGVAADRNGVLDELKEWAERELLTAKYAKPDEMGRMPPDAKLGVKWGIKWARKTLLDHIEAVRL